MPSGGPPYYGKWSVMDVFEARIDNTWPAPTPYATNLITPTSIASTGTGNSSSIGANGSVTFSSCATLSLNGVFSSDYDNYMISIRHNASAAATVLMRLRASGTDNSSSVYTVQAVEAYDTTVAGRRDTAQTRFSLGPGASVERGGHDVWTYGPYLTQPTAIRNISTGPWSAGFPGYFIDNVGTHSESTAFDGLTLYPSTGTITGRVSVYGLGG